MTHLLTAVAAVQLFRTLVATGAQLYLGVAVCRLQLHALHVDQADLAVTPLADHLGAGGAVPRVAGEGAGVGAPTGAGLTAARLTHLTPRPVALGDRVALPGAAVVAAGQRSPAGPLTGEGALLVTRNGTHLMVPQAGGWYGYLTRRTGQSFLDEGRLRWLLPGTC